jgi:hypothetical protein
MSRNQRRITLSAIAGVSVNGWKTKINKKSCEVSKNGMKAVVCGSLASFLRHGHTSHPRHIGVHDLSTPIYLPKEKSDWPSISPLRRSTRYSSEPASWAGGRVSAPPCVCSGCSLSEINWRWVHKNRARLVSVQWTAGVFYPARDSAEWFGLSLDWPLSKMWDGGRVSGGPYVRVEYPRVRCDEEINYCISAMMEGTHDLRAASA